MLALMPVQVLLSFDACITLHAVQDLPILLMMLLMNVILCLPLARFLSNFPVIARYSIVSFYLHDLKNAVALQLSFS